MSHQDVTEEVLLHGVQTRGLEWRYPALRRNTALKKRPILGADWRDE